MPNKNWKKVFTLRLRKEICESSSQIPFFRKNLELYAEKLYSDWLVSKQKEGGLNG